MKDQLKLLLLSVVAATTFAAQSVQIDFKALLPEVQAYIEQMIQTPGGIDRGAEDVLIGLAQDPFANRTLQEAKKLLDQGRFLLDLYLLNPAMALQTLQTARSLVELPDNVNNVVNQAFAFIIANPATFTVLAQQVKILVDAVEAQAGLLAIRDAGAINNIKDLAVDIYNTNIKGLIAQNQEDLDNLFKAIANMDYTPTT